MEGILFIAQVGVSVFGGLITLLIASGTMLLGYLSDEQVERPRIYWAEWPLPDSSEKEVAAKEEERKAA